MEFPELGQHCSTSSCKMLDFLPMKCDACQKIFCTEHFSYAKHNCPESYKKDNQVPVCPLCNIPIPLMKGQAPDMVVGQHIDTDCQSDPAKEKRKVYTNKCRMKGCKQKELVPVMCTRCHKNFCLRHRHETDHNCQGFEGSGQGMSSTGAAALQRASTSSGKASANQRAKPQQTTLASVGRDLDRERRERSGNRPPGSSVRAVQGNMSEDEAMARALAMSMQDTPVSTTGGKSQEEADAALARSLQAEEEAARNRRRPQPPPPQRQRSVSDRCQLS